MNEFWKKVTNTGKDYVRDFSVKTVVNYGKKLLAMHDTTMEGLEKVTHIQYMDKD